MTKKKKTTSGGKFQQSPGRNNKKVTNINTYRRGPYFNIGLFVFGVIFIYLVVAIAIYLTDEHVQAYEVREGSILKDTAYTGIAIRSETVVNSQSDGYINYFAPEDSKVGAKTDVYTLSSQKLEFQDSEKEDGRELSADEQESLVVRLQSFSENFKYNDFKSVYSLKNNIQTALESKSARSRQTQLAKMIENTPDLATVYKASSDGIISYTIDGYESVTADQVTEQMVQKENYVSSELKNNTRVGTGDPIYKLITQDQWILVISLDAADVKELKDLNVLKVRFLKDNETEKADFEIKETSNGALGFLTFYKSMIRYTADRYLDIELILEDESGLKIPKSSVTEKKFYLVPEDYLTQDQESREMGVYLDTGKDNATFQKTEVYYRDNENGMVYLEPTAFEKDAVLRHPDSGKSYTLKKTGTLKGVYNINKGYAVFKQIQILCESDEYYIVQEGSDYGLSNYDHIALDSSIVKENDVVY